MIEAALAILAALFWSVGIIIIRKGLEKANFFSAILVITIIGTIFFGVLTLLLVPLNAVTFWSVLFFAFAGLLAPGLGRLFYYNGMSRLGASINASVFTTYPIFGAIVAIVLLNERPTYGIGAGIGFIVLGAVLIERNLHGGGQSTKLSRVNMIFPLLGAVTFASSQAFRKIGLNLYNEPIIGVALGYLTALCLFAALIALSAKLRKSVSLGLQTFRLFWRAGLCLCGGWFFAFYALRYGDVSVVVPLFASEPFFILLLSYVFLKGLEKITLKLLIGTFIIILGVSFVTMF
ncbi:MAG: EamA family transporter [Nitrososphaeria archaeon]|nr:EamA family transporter [Nitrososphaeria archaeon]